MRLDDPTLVAREYADDSRLRKRASAYTGVATGVDAREPALAAVREAAPRRVLEVGCGWGWVGGGGRWRRGSHGTGGPTSSPSTSRRGWSSSRARAASTRGLRTCKT